MGKSRSQRGEQLILGVARGGHGTHDSTGRLEKLTVSDLKKRQCVKTAPRLPAAEIFVGGAACAMGRVWGRVAVTCARPRRYSLVKIIELPVEVKFVRTCLV